MDNYAIPQESLCDNCTHLCVLEGTVCVGSKIYRRRYCGHPVGKFSAKPAYDVGYKACGWHEPIVPASLIEKTSLPNWDTDGGKAVSPRTWKRAFEICQFNWKRGKAFVSPCGDGSVCLSWTVGNMRFQAEILEGEAIHWARQEEGQAWEYGTASSPAEVAQELMLG